MFPTIIRTRFIIMMILSSLILIPGYSHASLIKLDRIVAIVNDDVITQQELKRETEAIVRQQQMQKLPLPPSNILVQKVLNRLILTRLQQQLAASSGIHVDDVLLNETLLNIARQNNMTLSQFHDALQRVTAVSIDPSGNIWATNNWILNGFTSVNNPGGHQVALFVGLVAPEKTPLLGIVRKP